MGEYVKCQDLLDEVIRIEQALLIENVQNTVILEDLHKNLEIAKRAHAAQVRHIAWYHYMH